MSLQDHDAVVIDSFNGLWDKGDKDSTPSDHFIDCSNIKYVGTKSFATRDGLGLAQDVAVPLGNVVRIYNFVTQDKNTLLVLTYDGTTGRLYHVVDGTTVYGPILSIDGMEDFAFVPYAGRAYISPFKSYGLIEKGLQSEFLYVYLGTGSAARKAAADAPTGTLTVGNGAAGYTDFGMHCFGVVFETDTGYLSPPAAFASFSTSAALSVSFSNVPRSLESSVTKRHIVATKVLKNFNGDTVGQVYYFIPGADINNNTATTLANISFYDADLLSDASHLADNFSEIPAGACLCLYHNRLCLAATYTDISIVYVSATGEPEAISQLDGILIVPPDGNPITNAQELRDILYVFKRNRTVAFTDNDDVPSSWLSTVVDEGNGCPVHGIGTVIDTGSSTVNYLIIASYKGIMIFNGMYALPELSWKISNFWLSQDHTYFKRIQLVNDSVNQILYCALPDRQLLYGNYQNGLDPKNIRWAPWLFDVKINTIALVNISELIIGAESVMV